MLEFGIGLLVGFVAGITFLMTVAILYNDRNKKGRKDE